MSVPPRLLALMDLARAVAARDATLGIPPIRVEAPAAVLAAPLSAGLRNLVERTIVLAPREAATKAPWGDGSAAAAAIGRLAAAHELYLDLETRGLPDLQAFGAEGRPRIVRLRARLGSPAEAFAAGAASEAPKLAAGIPGRVVIDLAVRADEVPEFTRFVAELGRARSIVDLRGRPADDDAVRAFQAAWPTFEQHARAFGLNLRVDPVGWITAGAPLDPLAPHEVLAEGFRAVFRPHRDLCPFPFLMLSLDADLAAHPCPARPGPALGPWTPDTWSEAAARLRRAHLDGSRPAACVGCPLEARVHRSLARSDAVLGTLRRPDLGTPGQPHAV